MKRRLSLALVLCLALTVAIVHGQPAQRALATGDAFTFGAATPQLIDYQSGGSAKDWPRTLDGALALDFDTVIPGHGAVTTKAELPAFRDDAEAMRLRVHRMLREQRTPEEIAAVLKSEFNGANSCFQACSTACSWS